MYVLNIHFQVTILRQSRGMITWAACSVVRIGSGSGDDTAAFTGSFVGAALLGIGDVAGKYFVPEIGSFLIYLILEQDQFTEYRQHYALFVVIAMLLVVAAFGLRGTVLRRLP